MSEASTAVNGGQTDWRRVVEPYIGPDTRRATFQLITTLGLLAVLLIAMTMLVNRSMIGGVVLVALPTAGLLVRTFILMHDCAHGSFFASRRLNDIVGYATGVLTLTPFGQWRRDHALHHASSGDLGRRGHGDVPTLTVREYQAKTARQRFLYRVIRSSRAVASRRSNPLDAWPALSCAKHGDRHQTDQQRVGHQRRHRGTRECRVVAARLEDGAHRLRVAVLLGRDGGDGSSTSTQFEDAYWTRMAIGTTRRLRCAGARISTLPAPLRWFTGNIGLHHVHHLAPRIPNHRLQRCHDENLLMQTAPVVTLRSGMTALRLALWDEDRGRLIRFDQIDAT